LIGHFGVENLRLSMSLPSVCLSASKKLRTPSRQTIITAAVHYL
jgi:hypothetical protein